MIPSNPLSPTQTDHSHGEQQRRKKPTRSMLLITLSLFLIVGSSFILLISLSTVNPPAHGPVTSFIYVSVTFDSSISYARALKTVTNLGFQPALLCAANSTSGSKNDVLVWQPVGQQDIFLRDHKLSITQFGYAPPDWLQRFHATAGVQNAQQKEDPSRGCSLSTSKSATLASGTVLPLSGAEGAIYARVTFASPLDTYDAALYSISNLGLSLADPCYDQAQAQWSNSSIHFPWQSAPSWHPMSQERVFTTTRTLVVVTSVLTTSSLWQSQLQAIPGVVTLKTSTTTSC